MGFPKKQIPQYPRRHWQIVGRAGTGKSTFAMRMRAPLLPIDADHRIDQVAHLNPDMLELSTNPVDHNDTDRIEQLLNENMRGAQVGTIIIDSLTAIIAPLVTKAIQDKEHGRAKNLYAAFKPKAMAMRQLQDAVTKWGSDTLWIYHLDDSNTEDGEKIIKETISKTEVARLMRSVNLKLEVVIEKGKRGIYVKWARMGRSGKDVDILWDETGTWLGMPERIERAVYDGLSQAEQAALENTLPETFDADATAIAWGFAFGARSEPHAFNDLIHARNAFEKLMRENNDPATMDERAALWIGEVLARVEAKQVTGENNPANGNGNSTYGETAPRVSDSRKITHNEFWARARAYGFSPESAQPFVKANTVGKETDWAGALRDLEQKANAEGRKLTGNGGH